MAQSKHISLPPGTLLDSSDHRSTDGQSLGLQPALPCWLLTLGSFPGPRPLASCCCQRLLKVHLLLLLTPGFLHQLQLCGRGWSSVCRFLRFSLQQPDSALHSPDQPGGGSGQHHPHTFLHAHLKVRAGQAGWVPGNLSQSVWDIQRKS